MKSSKSKWLAYTFMVGLIPVLTRLLAWGTTATGTVAPASATDFIAFGFVLHISVINELEHFSKADREWKTTQNAASVIFIALYSALYALTILGERNSSLIDAIVMLRSSIILAIVSSLLSFSVLHRMSKAVAC